MRADGGLTSGNPYVTGKTQSDYIYVTGNTNTGFGGYDTFLVKYNSINGDQTMGPTSWELLQMTEWHQVSVKLWME